MRISKFIQDNILSVELGKNNKGKIILSLSNDILQDILDMVVWRNTFSEKEPPIMCLMLSYEKPEKDKP